MTHEIDYDAIGGRVRRIRKKRGLTQQKLAEIAEVDPSNISHIERGATKLSLPTIVALANALNVTVDDLLCDNLEQAGVSYDRIVEELLADCSASEKRLITDTMLSLKENIRKARMTSCD